MPTKLVFQPADNSTLGYYKPLCFSFAVVRRGGTNFAFLEHNEQSAEFSDGREADRTIINRGSLEN